MLNKLIVASLPLMPKSLVYVFAKKYIAGSLLKDGIKVTKEIEKLGGTTTIDVLGEFVDSKSRALHEKDMSLQVIEAIKKEKLKSYLSIKPTSLGLGIDYDFAYKNILDLVTKAKEYGIFVRLDMENSPYTDLTFKIYKSLRDNGFDNVGFVIQAYMKRSYDDIVELCKYNPSVRLCKGIYNESADIAIKDKQEIRENYKELFKYLIHNTEKLGIATHDEELINFAEEYIKKHNISKDKYEFQMLLGVRENKRNELLRNGHNLRIYVPFGEDWYGYSTRRLKENPEMAGHIFKSIFSKG